MPRETGLAPAPTSDPCRSPAESYPGSTPEVRPSPYPVRVLALASYPEEAAATRCRIVQFIGPLAERGFTVDFRPFLTGRQFHSLYRRRAWVRTVVGLIISMLRRILDLSAARSADVVLVQREVLLFGPPLFEYVLARLLRKPMVLDLDDATYIPYASPTYGRLTGLVKCFRKTDDLIRWSRVVVCGNPSIAAHAKALGTMTVVIPSVVDTERFHPANPDRREGLPVLGWVGSHSTSRYLESIFPALERLARTFPFRLLVVGSGRLEFKLAGVEVDCRDWELGREVADFQEIDVGLYPIIDEAWALGKSGFKAIQYMAVGVPYVVSPVGACAEIGEPGVTHLAAATLDQWHDALAALLRDRSLRARMGDAGRRHALAHYTVSRQADKLAQTLRLTVEQEIQSRARGQRSDSRASTVTPHSITSPCELGRS